MDNAICRMTGCEFPLFAFSHCRDVVVAVSKAGGFGVLGAAAGSPDARARGRAWLDAQDDGKRSGGAVLVPEVVDARVMGFTSNAARADAISAEHKAFVSDLLGGAGIALGEADLLRREGVGITPENGAALMEVAFAHPIRLIANALGVPPKPMIAEGKRRGQAVAHRVLPYRAGREGADGVRPHGLWHQDRGIGPGDLADRGLQGGYAESRRILS
ncbi:MAG: hypothetical protein NVS3B5_16660 [Sphingomicrobium sp.]